MILNLPSSMNNLRAYKIFFLLVMLPVLALIVKSCASPGPLSGGEKDINPPIFLGSEPVMFSKNTEPKKVFMEFDEFLVLKELSQNLLISPPLNEEPEIKLRGKKVLIKNHKDLVLDSNTTYTYYFGNAICDLHEDNPIENFEFVFSTGPTLDSLSIRGEVMNARYLIPEEAIYVCLYKMGMNDTIPFDSLPYFVRPYYVARTNEFGEYQLNNLRYDDYLMFAVKDMNSNYYFDMPNEEIAFIDSLIIPQEVFDYIPDTIPIDTSDYYLMDSLWRNHSLSVVKDPIHLFMFSQDDSIPKLLETKVTEHQKIDFFFKFPVRDSIHIKLLNDSISLPWYKEEFSINRDTLTLWLSRIPHDSLKIELQVDTIQADTLNFLVRPAVAEKKENKRTRKKKKEKKEKSEKVVIKYKANLKTTLAYFKDIKINFETPLKYANFEYVVLIEDSIPVKPQITIMDSIQRNISIHYDWKQATKYKLVLPQESLIDMFGLENDSIAFDFTTSSDDDYGNIIMDLNFDSTQFFPVLISLVKGEAEKEQTLQKHRIISDTILTFPHVSEGDYLIKAMEDYNDNGKWNTGHFGNGLAPEAVYYFQQNISVKAGWDIEDKWTMTFEDKKRPKKIEKKKDDKKKKGKR